MSHPYLAIARKQAAQGVVSAEPPIRVSEEPEGSDCSCTGKVILWTLAGAVAGFGGAWMLNDAKKTELKQKGKAKAALARDKAKAAGARALERGAARLRG